MRSKMDTDRASNTCLVPYQALPGEISCYSIVYLVAVGSARMHAVFECRNQTPERTWVRKFAGFNFDVIGRVIVPVPVPRLVCIVCKVPVRRSAPVPYRRCRPAGLFKYYLMTKLKTLTYCLKP
jgi:hypothetical protein